ncbi:hypothetical protein TYRP_005554 [Tyrophagus putrescentiae]|nr:hypothetical protein TYRP_005554 [Tyrophagus putrescentiae]
MPLSHTSDFELTVPYGAIRGKVWSNSSCDGKQEIVRIIALHGWQDNCGTFDALIPKLPENYYIVAIDFPGHGLSSHLPAGSPYNDIIFVVELERVIQKLGWKERPFTILGHSMGAAIALFYACLYPKAVQRIVALDMIKPLTFQRENLAAKTREGIEQFLQLEAKTMKAETLTNGATTNGGGSSSAGIPTYDFDQAVVKLIQAHSGAEYLLKRGSKSLPGDPGKVYFTRDNRLKAMLFQRMDYESLIHYFAQLDCELLIVKAEKGVKLDPDAVSDLYIELYTRQCSRFEYAKVPGGHHVHLCQPDNVYPIVAKFISGEQYQNGTSTTTTATTS